MLLTQSPIIFFVDLILLLYLKLVFLMMHHLPTLGGSYSNIYGQKHIHTKVTPYWHLTYNNKKNGGNMGLLLT